MLRSVGSGIWVSEQPLSMLGIEYGARMTVIRLSDGAVMVISPIRITDELAAAVSGLGEVRYLIAPNSFHHLFMAGWTSRFPKADLFAVSQLVKKRPDLKISQVMDKTFRPQWGEEVGARFIEGGSLYSEAVFFHAPSKTLILTDLCFNIHQKQGWLATSLLKMYGIYEKFGPSKAVGLFMGDKRRLKQAADEIARWDFVRVIVAHGDILEPANPAEFSKLFEVR